MSAAVETPPLLKIGDVAARSGLPVKTVRYYDDLGLLAPVVSRSRAGYRLFDAAVFGRLGFIQRARNLGLSLSDIGDILAVRDRCELPCGEVKARLQQKRAEIARQIAALQVLDGELRGLLSGWEDAPELTTGTICPNLQPEGVPLAESRSA